MAQVVLFGQSGQSLRHIPPARVTSADYVIEDLTRADDASDRVIASGAATVANWSLTTNAPAGPSTTDARRIPVQSTDGATVGAAAAIEAADGSEIFEIAGVSSGTHIIADTGLAATYPSGSTVHGLALTASIPVELYANEDILEQRRPLRVVWTYQIGGVTLKKQELVEFRRHSTGATTSGGEAVLRLRKLYPDLPGRLPDHANLDTIARELASIVEDDLRQRLIAPERFLAGPAGVQLLLLRIVAHAGELGYAPGAQDQAAWARGAHARYRERLEALVIGEPGEATAETSFVSDTAAETPSHEYRGPTLRM